MVTPTPHPHGNPPPNSPALFTPGLLLLYKRFSSPPPPHGCCVSYSQGFTGVTHCLSEPSFFAPRPPPPQLGPPGGLRSTLALLPRSHCLGYLGVFTPPLQALYSAPPPYSFHPASLPPPRFTHHLHLLCPFYTHFPHLLILYVQFAPFFFFYTWFPPTHSGFTCGPPQGLLALYTGFTHCWGGGCTPPPHMSPHLHIPHHLTPGLYIPHPRFTHALLQL